MNYKDCKILAWVSVLIFSFLAVPVIASQDSVQPSSMTLIPNPLKVERVEGCFTFDSKTIVYVEKGNDELLAIAKMFVERLKPAAGMKLKIKKTSEIVPRDGGVLLTTKPADQTLGTEGYELNISPKHILLRAPSAAGIFYGTQSIRQLLPKEIESTSKVDSVEWTVPCMNIYDKPAFQWRGFMLDSCRHFQTTDFIKRYLDLMAFHKLNVFHWHLTEDEAWRIEIKKYPKLTSMGAWPGTNAAEEELGGFYTEKDIREIVAYAKSRYITVVPEIDMPGHATAALVAYPELSCKGGPFNITGSGRKLFVTNNGRHAFCAGNDETLVFIKDVLTEVIEMFDTPYIHVGGDERPKGLWDNCPKCQARIKELGLENESQLQNWFMVQVNDFIQSHRRRSMGWAENMEDGIPKNQIVQSWHPGETEFAVQEMGFQVVNSTNGFTYLDYPSSRQQKADHPDWMPVMGLKKMYSFSPVPKDFTVEQSRLILGIEAPIWTEEVKQERMDFKVFPRLLATIEIAWIPGDTKDFDEFCGRVKRYLERLDIMGVTYDKTLPSLN